MHTAAVSVIPGGRVGVLLVHSLGGNPVELRFVAQGLARAGYTVYCPLLPGLGGGTDSLGLSSWRDWYAAHRAGSRRAQGSLRRHHRGRHLRRLHAGAAPCTRARRSGPRPHPLCADALAQWLGDPAPFPFLQARSTTSGWRSFCICVSARRSASRTSASATSSSSPSSRKTGRSRILFGRGGGLVWEFNHARQRGASPARRDQAADRDHPSA